MGAEHRIASALGELSAAGLARDALEGKLQQQLEHNRTLEQKVRQMQWEATDLLKSNVSRIAGLEESLKQVCTTKIHSWSRMCLLSCNGQAQSKSEDDKKLHEEQHARSQMEWESRQKVRPYVLGQYFDGIYREE